MSGRERKKPSPETHQETAGHRLFNQRRRWSGNGRSRLRVQQTAGAEDYGRSRLRVLKEGDIALSPAG